MAHSNNLVTLAGSKVTVYGIVGMAHSNTVTLTGSKVKVYGIKFTENQRKSCAIKWGRIRVNRYFCR